MKYRGNEITSDKLRTIGGESLGFGIAEGVSAVVSLGVVGVADTLIPKPIMQEATQAVAKVCVMPFLDTIESGLSKVCKLEECQVDKNQSREERAEKIARALLLFGSAWALSLAAKIGTRRGWNHLNGIADEKPAPTGNWLKDKINHKLAPNELKLFAIDEGIHYGSLFLMNTVFAKDTDKLIHTVSGILEKHGMSKQKANEVATMAIVWEGSNLLGFGAGLGQIAHRHLSSTNAGMVSADAIKVAQSLVTPNLSKS